MQMPRSPPLLTRSLLMLKSKYKTCRVLGLVDIGQLEKRAPTSQPCGKATNIYVSLACGFGGCSHHKTKYSTPPSFNKLAIDQHQHFTMAPKVPPFNLQTCARPNILALEPYRCAREYGSSFSSAEDSLNH